MIKITDVTGKEKYLNCDLIEKIELVPDTLVGLVNGRNIIVLETPEEIIKRITEFKRRCNMPALVSARREHDTEEDSATVLIEETEETEDR